MFLNVLEEVYSAALTFIPLAKRSIRKHIPGNKVQPFTINDRQNILNFISLLMRKYQETTAFVQMFGWT